MDVVYCCPALHALPPDEEGLWRPPVEDKLGCRSSEVLTDERLGNKGILEFIGGGVVGGSKELKGERVES